MGFETHTGSVQIKRRDFLRHASLAGLIMAGGLPGVSWAVRGNELHIRNYQDILSFDPPNGYSMAEGIVEKAMYQCLLQFKADGSWDTELDAAEYFEAIDDTHYEFRLKKGQMFSNGFGEMTADDVKFSYERAIDPAMNALNAPDMGTLSHVEVHDRYSGTLVLHSPYAAMIPVAVASSTASILSRNAVESVGGRFTTQPPACSGPYVFASWQAMRKTVLKRNPLWTGPEVAFEEIHIYAMTDDKAAEMAYEAGQLDSALISVESTEPFRNNMPPNSHIEIYPSGRNYWLGINQSNPALRDIRVRQAIQWATDVGSVVEATWFGLAEPSTGPIPRGMLGHRERALIPPEGDAEKARELLKQAGVELPLLLRLDVPNDTLYLTPAQVVQWSLKKVGIEIEIRTQDASTFMTLGSEAAGDQWQDIQLFIQSFVGGADPYYPMTWFISKQMGLWNWERFANKEFDQLNDDALATNDVAERTQMYHRMQDLMEESGCYRFISNGVMPQIIRNTIKPAFAPDGYPMLRDFQRSGLRT